MLSEGKTVKYLKYAIGEIILVVIGILIALQINNWNQNRYTKQEEMNYYKNLKRELNEDSSIIMNNVNFNRYYYDQYLFAIDQIERNDRSQLDSLAKVAINLLEYSDFHQETNAYEALVNSGEIKILKNQKIVEGLQRLGEIYIYINKLERSHFEVVKLIYVELKKIVDINSQKIIKEELLYNYEFQNNFVISSDIMTEKDEIYNRALDEIQSILKMIEKELENTN